MKAKGANQTMAPRMTEMEGLRTMVTGAAHMS